MSIEKLIHLIKSASWRMEILHAVSSLELPHCYVAAGFIRNLVWDHLHDFESTPLADIDVIYYSQETHDESFALKTLKAAFPSLKWDVKNQAFMHIKNEQIQYSSVNHAMKYWPELETAIAVRIVGNGELDILAPFGTTSLFAGHITYNPACKREVFLNRVKEKRWMEKWPKLRLVTY